MQKTIIKEPTTRFEVRAVVKSGNFAKAALELQLNPLPLAELGI